jgi:hypothetical protein
VPLPKLGEHRLTVKGGGGVGQTARQFRNQFPAPDDNVVSVGQMRKRLFDDVVHGPMMRQEICFVNSAAKPRFPKADRFHGCKAGAGGSGGDAPADRYAKNSTHQRLVLDAVRVDRVVAEAALFIVQTATAGIFGRKAVLTS